MRSNEETPRERKRQARSRIPFTAVLVLGGLALLATTGSAQWTRTAGPYIPYVEEMVQASCIHILGYPLGHAYADVTSTGHTARGGGSAFDGSIGCDVTAQQGGTGVWSESWTHSPGEGWARIEATVEAKGSAVLENADCAAAALGWAEFSSNMAPVIRAILTESAAETGANQLGNVNLGGLGGVNVTVGTGTGPYPDADVDTIVRQDCRGFVTRKHRSHGFIKVWANAVFPGTASCRATMKASVDSTLTLGECP